MNFLYKITIITTIIILFTSCEKVIDIDLKDAKEQLVVDANIYNGIGKNIIILTKSSSFYENTEFKTVSNANIIITDNDGNGYTLSEIKKGIYTNNTLNAKVLTEYKLNISVNENTISASSIMPKLITLDTIIIAENENKHPGGAPNQNEGKNYKFYIQFKDPIDELNYYRIKISVNKMYFPEIFVTDDALFNGQNTELPIRLNNLFSGDSISVKLISIDKANYEYYRLLSENDMGAMSTSVGNPVSNVKGTDVIGIFGANAISEKMVIIP